MNRMERIGLVLAIPLWLWAAVSCSQAPQSAPATESQTGADATSHTAKRTEAPPPKPQQVTIPTGTALRVVLDQTLSTASAHSGDTFRATVVEPVVVNGVTVIPKNASVVGHVVEAQSSGRLKGVARLVLTLDSVEVAGKSYPLETSTVSRSGSSHKKRNIEIIGGGTALGAIIGGIAGGGKGAAIGAAAGAGAGTATAAATGKKEIRLPAESMLVFRLRSPVEIAIRP